MRASWLYPSAALALAVTMLAVPPAPVGAQTGAIEGTVVLEPPPPPRRTVNRYAGEAAAPEAVQRVPAVVYAVGSVGGASSSRPSVEMTQRDTAFVPAAVVIPVGGSVEFPNDDPFFHNVFSYSSTQRFDLGRYPQGESKAVEFDEAGVVAVFCEVHDKMRGVIIVTENPYHAIVAEDGSYRIEGLPPGTHEVAFWSADHRPVEKTVEVIAGRTTQVDVELNR